MTAAERNRLTRTVVAGDCVVLEEVMRATPRGSFWGLPASGQSIRLPIVLVIPFRDGKILGERAYFDSDELKRQLGPVPGGAERGGGV